jgi:hypothetical protein
MREVLLDNLRAVAAYWWVILVGVIMPFIDLIKFLHPTKHIEFKLHPSVRIGLAALAIIIAQLLAFRDQARNLQIVIEDKKQFSIEVNSRKQQVHELSEQIVSMKSRMPDDTSLKIRLMRAADEYEHFWRNYPKGPTCTQTSDMTPEQQRKVIEPCSAYSQKREDDFQRLMAPRMMELVQEVKAKGMDVKNMENCASVGYCGIPMSVQLRAFSLQLDGHDNVKGLACLNVGLG